MSRIVITLAAGTALAAASFATPSAGAVSAATGAPTASGAVAAAVSPARAGSARYSDPEWLPVREQSALHCTTVMRKGVAPPVGTRRSTSFPAAVNGGVAIPGRSPTLSTPRDTALSTWVPKA